MTKKQKMRRMPKLARGGLDLSSFFSIHCTVFKSGQAILQHGFIGLNWLTTHTIFAIGNKNNNMIFLIILVNLLFESRDPEADAESDKADGSYKNLGKLVFFTVVKKDNNR